MPKHPVSPKGVVFFFFKVSKMTKFNDGMFKGSKMTNFNYGLFKVSKMTNFNFSIYGECLILHVN